MSFFGIICAALIVVFAVFMNYPPPPESPILHQWKNSGKFFTFKDFKVFYIAELGIGENDSSVICLHGFPTSSFDWYKVLPDLRKSFKNIILVDFLGFGFSEKPRHHTYTIAEQADLVEQLVTQELGIKKVHLLSHDYGDTVLQELLARIVVDNSSNLLIESICLLNGGLFPEYHHPRFLQKLLRIPVLRTIVSRFGNYYFFRHGMSEIFGDESQPSDEDLHNMWTLLRLNDGYRILPNLLHYIDERLEFKDRWLNGLQKSTIKTHMVYGVKDPVNPPPFADHYRKMLPSATIEVLEDIGHYVQLEAPKEMMSSYKTFLTSI